MVDALVHAMEVKGRMLGAYFVPDAHTLYSAQVLTQQLYARVILALRDLAGGGLIMLPSSVQDFADPELRSLIEKTQQSPVTSSEGRVKFFKLAWDAVGSEFASRHTQYEMFYAGATFVTKGHSFRTFDWDRCTQLVDHMLDSYSLDDEVDRAPLCRRLRFAMPIDKEHKEFHAIDMTGEGWHTPPGYPPGIEQKILAGRLDEAGKTGHRTRLLRFAPGAYTTVPFVHEYWEEVYLIAGDLIDLGSGKEKTFLANTYACRPPGIYHGPFRSKTGCLLLETHYYA